MVDATGFSTTGELDALKEKIVGGVTAGGGVTFLNDIDGHSVNGWNVLDPKRLDALYPMAPGDNPKDRAIPSTVDSAAMLEFEKAGIVERTLFATQRLDVRLPVELVTLINEILADTAHPERLYEIGFLTSRDVESAREILRSSGVTDPNRVTLIADSGAIIYLNGERIPVRELLPKEIEFRDSLVIGTPLLNEMQAGVDAILEARGIPLEGRPILDTTEQKGVARNIHFRALLDYCEKLGASRDELEAEIKTYLAGKLGEHVAAHSPRIGDDLGTPSEAARAAGRLIGPIPGALKDGASIFKVLTAPDAVEAIVADIDKGVGAEQALVEMRSRGYVPDAVVVGGDDIQKGKDGTDTPSVNAANRHQQEREQSGEGASWYSAYTRHPGKPSKDDIEQPGINAVFRTVGKNIGFTVSTIRAAEERSAELAQAQGADFTSERSQASSRGKKGPVVIVDGVGGITPAPASDPPTQQQGRPLQQREGNAR